jgi:hypothetical protein
MARTHQRISEENQQRLATIGLFGQSFNGVIGKLIDFWEEGHVKNKSRENEIFESLI